MKSAYSEACGIIGAKGAGASAGEAYLKVAGEDRSATNGK